MSQRYDMSKFTLRDGKWWSEDDLDPLNPTPYQERGFTIGDDEAGTIENGSLECECGYDFPSMKAYVEHFENGEHDDELGA